MMCVEDWRDILRYHIIKTLFQIKGAGREVRAAGGGAAVVKVLHPPVCVRFSMLV